MVMPCFWAIKDYTYQHRCDGYIITVTTNTPCHLFMLYTTEPPRIHIIPTYKRGIMMHGDPYFCFVAYTENNQEEAGDTLTHTFIKLDWPVCQTRYFYFIGSIGGVFCPSTSAIFELHFDIIHQTFIGTSSNRHVQYSHALWTPCHDNATGTIPDSYDTPWFLIFAGESLVATYWLYRGMLFFPTSALPSWAVVVGGWLSLYVIDVLWTSSIAFPHLCITQGVQSEPVVPADYGSQLPYTTIGGQIDLRTLIPGQYNRINLNTAGLGWINPAGKTRFCLRGEQDILDIPPPLGTNWARFRSRQAGSSLAPVLTLCYTPQAS